MQARDAAGRRVSLLNDDSYTQQIQYQTTTAYSAVGDRSPLPHTPELLRSDSYDSNNSYDAVSPLTPGIYDYVSRSAYDDYLPDKKSSLNRPAYVASSRSDSYDEDASTPPGPEKQGKRYPCRYRDSHGCEKTFTTSGHASRHSKIHTAEKAVQCTFSGCHKKFTRADNMKQHLETHYKDKSRSTTSSKSSSKHSGASSSSSSKRGSTSSKSTSSHRRQDSNQDVPMWDSELYDSSPASDDAWDLRRLNLPLMSRPCASRTASSGLDALAAIACREGA